jgi:hypothetical protein
MLVLSMGGFVLKSAYCLTAQRNRWQSLYKISMVEHCVNGDVVFQNKLQIFTI